VFHFTSSFLCWPRHKRGHAFFVGCIFFGKEILLLRFRESLPSITRCALPAIAKDVIMRDTNTVMENGVDDNTARDLHWHTAEVTSQLVLHGDDRLGASPGCAARPVPKLVERPCESDTAAVPGILAWSTRIPVRLSKFSSAYRAATVVSAMFSWFASSGCPVTRNSPSAQSPRVAFVSWTKMLLTASESFQR